MKCEISKVVCLLLLLSCAYIPVIQKDAVIRTYICGVFVLYNYIYPSVEPPVINLTK